MDLRWGTAALIGSAALSLASCSAQGADSAGSPASGRDGHVDQDTERHGRGGGQPPAPAAGDSRQTGRGDTLTVACPVLTASEVQQILGGGESATQITATEGEPDDEQADKIFECDYGVAGDRPFTLDLGDITEFDFSAAEAVTAFVQQAKAKPQPVPNLGQAAYFPLPTGDAMLAMAKRSPGELRTATFEAPKIVPVAGLAQLMALVDSRL